jgi:hypothetical protein
VSKFPRELAKKILPVDAQRKLVGIANQLDEAAAVVADSSMRSTDLRRSIQRLEKQRDFLQKEGGSGRSPDLVRFSGLLQEPPAGPPGGARPMRTSPVISKSSQDDGRLNEVVAELAVLNDEYRELNERAALYGPRQAAAAGLLQSVIDWLNLLPKDTTIQSYSRSDVKVREVMSSQIEKQRQRIRGLQADLRQIDAAPYTTADAKKRALAEIEQLAERGRPGVHQLIEQRESTIDWPASELDTMLLRPVKANDGIALVAWLYRGDLIKAVAKEIDSVGDDTRALTDEQRFDRFKVCLADLLQAERDEEALIESATFEVLRRIDADPRAVLGLDISLGPKRNLLHREMIETLSASGC